MSLRGLQGDKNETRQGQGLSKFKYGEGFGQEVKQKRLA